MTDCKSLYYACLIFSIQTLCYTSQVWIFGEKIGEGIGKTRKEAQCQAADTSLRNLAGELRSTPCSFYSQLELLMCNVIGGRGGGDLDSNFSYGVYFILDGPWVVLFSVVDS